MDRDVVLEKWVTGWPMFINTYYIARDLGISQDAALVLYGRVGPRVSMALTFPMGDVRRAIRTAGLVGTRP